MIQPKTETCSFIVADDIYGCIAKKIQMLDLGSPRFFIWQDSWLRFRSRPISTDRKMLNTQGLIQAVYSTDYLRTYEYFILPSVTYQGKQLTTQIESLNC